MTITLTAPSEVGAVSKRDAGGDNTVPRDHMDRPLVLMQCWKCEGSGTLPSEKRPPPATIKCQRCSGKGERLEAHTRVTTFIDVLDDKSNLMAWGKRKVLQGAALDPKLLNDVLTYDEQEKDGKDALNRRAEAAATLAGSKEKADKGTHLHGLSELVDEGKELPNGISFGDVIDMDAYKKRTVPHLTITHMERLVVNAQYKCAGTPDRVSRWTGDTPLVAPDGYVFTSTENIITDLKTGSVEYGGLKMAMQLAIYANSELYDHETGAREALENINLKWGIIMHLPAGSGECFLYWADLTLGWAAVAIAYEVREIRKAGRKALIEFSS